MDIFFITDKEQSFLRPEVQNVQHIKYEYAELEISKSFNAISYCATRIIVTKRRRYFILEIRRRKEKSLAFFVQ